MPSSRRRRLSRSNAWRRAACSTGIPRDLVRDGVERQGLLRLEQHEDEIGDALEPVQLGGGRGRGGHLTEPTRGGMSVRDLGLAGSRSTGICIWSGCWSWWR